jgi:hypothetical protein
MTKYGDVDIEGPEGDPTVATAVRGELWLRAGLLALAFASLAFTWSQLKGVVQGGGLAVESMSMNIGGVAVDLKKATGAVVGAVITYLLARQSVPQIRARVLPAKGRQAK